MRHPRSEPVALITSAPQSNDDEYEKRRRKYALMMFIRAMSIIGAALTYRVSIWLALALVVGSMVLPWCAVLIANDRPAKKRAPRSSYHSGSVEERAITAQPTRIVDG